MTILPSFLRLPRRSPRKARSFRCEALESRRLLAITIDVGTTYLLPNTPNQTVGISATSNDPNEKISGLNLNALLGDGNGGLPNPQFTAVDFTAGTVWTNAGTGFTTTPDPLSDAVDGGSFLSGGVALGNGSTCALGVCDFAPTGLIATLTIDTTGFTSGDFDLLLSSPGNFITSFPITGTTSVTPVITNGKVVINTSPTADAVLSPDTSYTVDFGGSVQLNGTESFDSDFGDSIQSYEWDLNSGTFVGADTSGATPTVTWSQLTAAGITTSGTYPITLRVTDSSGLSNGTDSVTVNLVVNPATVEGRHIFYNNSFYDSNAFLGFPDDDSAIDDSKSALLPGETATFANYSGTAKGINGIMIDVAGSVDQAFIENLANLAINFDFTVNTSNITFNPTPTFTDFPLDAAPAPSAVTVRPGAGDNGEDRISIFWADGVIKKQWLRVTLLANNATGLATDDIFYFGNEVGETGDSTTNAFVDGTDFGGTRDNPHDFISRAPVSDAYDFNKDSFVDGTDLGVPRDNANDFLSALKLISAPPASAGKTQLSFAPETETVSIQAESILIPEDSQPVLKSEGENQSSFNPEWVLLAQVEKASGQDVSSDELFETDSGDLISNIDQYMSEYSSNSSIESYVATTPAKSSGADQDDTNQSLDSIELTTLPFLE